MEIFVFSDIHTGSSVALWPEKHEVEGGGTYEANKPQKWLHDCFRDATAEVQSVPGQKVIVLNGDLIQGSKSCDGQLITSQLHIQRKAAYKLLKPLVDACDSCYVVRGTEWHDGKAADDVEDLASSLGAVVDPSTGQSSWWELYLDVGGPVIHFAHHIGTSSVPWYEATVPLRDALMELAELWRFYGANAPNVRMVVRSHRHRFIHVQAPPDLQALVTPAWQLKTAFAHKKATSMLPQIGYVRISWDGEDLLVRPRIYELPKLHVEFLGNKEPSNA